MSHEVEIVAAVPEHRYDYRSAPEAVEARE
jgi:hypothetical protein